ncbi:hypothetical protein K503DRAFT_690876, partial [Rhizopogon vinicolor AM-OR11-026]
EDKLLGKDVIDIEFTLKRGEFDGELSSAGGVRGKLYLEMTFYANTPPPLNRLTVFHGRARIMLYHPKAGLYPFLQMRRRHLLDAPLTLHLCSSATRGICPRLRSPEGNQDLRHNPQSRHLNFLCLLLSNTPRRVRSTLSRPFLRKSMLHESPVIW